jgi:hypothetical protein
MRQHRIRQRSHAAGRALDELDSHATSTSAPVPEDPGLAAEIASMRALTTLLAEVPAEAWQPIPTPEPEAAPSPATRHRRWLTRSHTLAGAAALACLAIGFAVGALVNHGRGGPASTRPPQAAAATLRPLPGQPPAAVARAQLASTGRIVISFRRLPRPGAHHFYEAWLMTSATKLVPVASFRPDARGRARVETSLPAPVGAFRYIDVSLQRAGAGPAHSSDSVLRGPTAPLAHPHG